MQDTEQFNYKPSKDCINLKHDKDFLYKYDMSNTSTYLTILKEKLNTQKQSNEDQKRLCEKQKSEINHLKEMIVDKDKEIGILKHYTALRNWKSFNIFNLVQYKKK